MQKELAILYQDAHVLVVNKPSGLVSVPGKGRHARDSLTHRVRERFPDCPVSPAVHRLDMDTSGAMIFALDTFTHQFLSKQFELRLVRKEYVAILQEPLLERQGTIELPFRLDPDDRPRQIYDPVYGKLGKTQWELVENTADGARVLFKPLTGRTHQLRTHAAHEKGLGSPIVGDTLYGSGTQHGALRLHASLLEFMHPVEQKMIGIQCDPEW